jgi:hypothetical protein
MSANHDLYDLRILKSGEAIFSRSPGGVLQGVIDGTPYEELTVYRAFPIRYTAQYISIRTPKGDELGIIADLNELDEESRRELSRELDYRYFLPKVLRVESVKQRTDLWIWEVETTLGPTRITMRNLHEYVQFHGDGRMVLTDLNGKRCEITDWRSLDAHSRKQLADVI